MRVLLLALASTGFGVALTLALTKPPVFLAMMLKLLAVVRRASGPG